MVDSPHAIKVVPTGRGVLDLVTPSSHGRNMEPIQPGTIWMTEAKTWAWKG